MFSTMPEKMRPAPFNDLGNGLQLEISDESTEVDDILVEKCIEDRDNDNIPPLLEQHQSNLITIEDIIEDFKKGLVESAIDCYSTNDTYVVVKRKGGGSKTKKKLFDKLCLRRAEEGAFCLIPSLLSGNPRLQKNSLQVARELQRAKVHHVVEYERRPCKDVRSVVVTDDVLLSDRVVKEGGIVMRYCQLRQLI